MDEGILLIAQNVINKGKASKNSSLENEIIEMYFADGDEKLLTESFKYHFERMIKLSQPKNIIFLFTVFLYWAIHFKDVRPNVFLSYVSVDIKNHKDEFKRKIISSPPKQKRNSFLEDLEGWKSGLRELGIDRVTMSCFLQEIEDLPEDFDASEIYNKYKELLIFSASDDNKD